MSVLDELMWTYVSGESPEDNSFKCRWKGCFLSIQEPTQLEVHLEEHMLNDPHCTINVPCGVDRCGIQCSDPDQLHSHIKLHIHHALSQKNGLKYLRENNDFESVSNFLQHLKNHVHFAEPAPFNDGKAYFTCSWANVFRDKFGFDRHLMSHSSFRTLACPFCGTSFNSTTRLVDHVQRRAGETENERFVCYLCNKVFGSQRVLREHCERHVNRFSCHYCGYVVNRESDLKAHIDAVHNKNRPFLCEKCNRTYAKKSDLTKHLATHVGQVYRCAQCEAEFSWQKQLKHHLLTHNPDYIKSPYLCHICGSTYQRGSALSKHLRTFHKLTVPVGFTRFQFKKCQDNMYRLETERVLTDELKQIGMQVDQSPPPMKLHSMPAGSGVSDGGYRVEYVHQ